MSARVPISSRIPTSTRIRASVRATFAGWLAAALVTLVFEAPELARNAPPGGLAHDLVSGLALWAAFTLVVCGGVWCLVVLPLAAAVPAQTMVRRRLPVTIVSGLSAVCFVGWRLGTWSDLLDHGPQNPLAAIFFLQYSTFAFTLACVTTIVYAHLLRGVAPGPVIDKR